MRNASVVLVAAFCLGLSLPALAQGNSNKENGHGHGGPPPGHAGGPPTAATSTSQHASAVMVPDHDRTAISSYYRTEYNAGRCPPGLAMKHNGCLPPGQAKRMWEIGRPLPPDIYYEPLPAYLVGRTSPPGGYQYVRVANDVLLMAIGTRMIAAAVADLSSF